MRIMKQLSVIIALFFSAITVKGQSADFYVANISGASSIVLNQVDYRSFDYGIDHRFVYGTIYPNESGVIRLNLPRGQYEYIAEADGMRSKHGTFYISGKDLYFDVQLTPLDPGTEDELRSSRQLVKDGNDAVTQEDFKKARELFYQAALDGNADGMYSYAFMLKNGIGGSTNKKEALSWLEQALSHGHYAAQQRIDYFKDKWDWGESYGYGKPKKFIQ